ncbi:helix-turn-helix domain-containing protein [Primorskyibacter sp. 2E107]|uniref:helix-turn-helix domain-containing protein n=1 Tax=Primorskyibacter sp. 2E107 TaxID=3403458 RepID=UPI003AF96B47
MLTVEDVASHWNLTSGTILRYIAAGRLPSQRLNRQHRVAWEDVWGCEEGPYPRSAEMRKRNELPLVGKTSIAAALNVSLRTVDSWIADGMPTRRVFSNVRANPVDVSEWLRGRFGFEIDPEELLPETPSHSATEGSMQ